MRTHVYLHQCWLTKAIINHSAINLRIRDCSTAPLEWQKITELNLQTPIQKPFIIIWRISLFWNNTFNLSCCNKCRISDFLESRSNLMTDKIRPRICFTINCICALTFSRNNTNLHENWQKKIIFIFDKECS